MQNERLGHHRFVALGQLAAGVAHEINTPVQFIGDNSHFVRQAYDDLFELLDAYHEVLFEGSVDAARVDALRKLRESVEVEYLREEIPSALQQTLDGVGLVAEIVKAMKTFSHPGGTVVPMDINELVRTTRLVSRSEWKLIARFDLDLEESLPLLQGDPAPLRQALFNIVVNACHAVDAARPEGQFGHIVVATRRHEESSMQICVTDTGGGIPAEVQARMFEPFFTTKPAGKGTGQGLPIAREAIEREFGGTLRCEVEPGASTTFVITLPVPGVER